MWTNNKSHFSCKKAFPALGGKKEREGSIEGERLVWPGTREQCSGSESVSADYPVALDHWLQPPLSKSDTGKLREWVSVSRRGTPSWLHLPDSLCGQRCSQSLFVRSSHLFSCSVLVHLSWFQRGEFSFLYFIRILTHSLKMSFSMSSDPSEIPYSE